MENSRSLCVLEIVRCLIYLDHVCWGMIWNKKKYKIIPRICKYKGKTKNRTHLAARKTSKIRWTKFTDDGFIQSVTELDSVSAGAHFRHLNRKCLIAVAGDKKCNKTKNEVSCFLWLHAATKLNLGINSVCIGNKV